MTRAASVTAVRRTTEADRGTILPADRPLEPWIAIDTKGRRFLADTEHEARAMCERYNGLRANRKEAA